MKNLQPLLFVFLLANCSEKEKVNMAGAYSMNSQTINYGSSDSAITRKQLKIFTDDHVIYAAMRMPDSLASFGIGTYDVKDGKVIEHFFYSSGNRARKDTIELSIEKTADGYRQTYQEVNAQNRKYTQREEYKNVGDADSTPLDGAWKLVNNFFVRKTGDTVTSNNITQFKVYQSGQFIWAAQYPDTAQRMLTFFGYGRFDMDGPNRSKEVNTLSTYPPIIDSTFNIELEFMGKDAYKQTIIQRDSARSIEVYERLKKT